MTINLLFPDLPASQSAPDVEEEEEGKGECLAPLWHPADPSVLQQEWWPQLGWEALGSPATESRGRDVPPMPTAAWGPHCPPRVGPDWKLGKPPSPTGMQWE